MRSILQKSKTPYGVIVAISCFAVLMLGVFFAAKTYAISPAVSSGKRLITIHDDGQDRGILTRATTMREALKEANIHLDANDTVEPALDEELVGNNYEANIYRARPVTIVDGAIRTKVMSPYRTASQIVKEAGMELHDEDTTKIEANTNVLSEGTGVQLTITRATPVTLVFYGKPTQTYTQAKTVGEMLDNKKITLSKDDTLSVMRSTPISKDMTIELWRNGKQTVTLDEDIAFTTRQIKDADRPVGYKNIDAVGETGKKTVTYEIEMKNGQEVGRRVIQSVVVKEPKEQTETIGMKHELPPGSHTDWMAAAGISSNDYGYVDFIISHESHWRPDAVSPNGYYGLGQTNLKAISSVCPNWQSDPICQLQFFTGYANSRYGSWSRAQAFWEKYGWW